MNAGCYHHRWMCHVVNRALVHEWHRWGLCDKHHGYHQISHGTPWRLSDIWSYVRNTTKQMTKSNRSGNDASRKHQLSLHTTLPTKNVALNVVHNNVQLINFICHYLINPNPTPVQVWNSFSLQREYLKTNHEEGELGELGERSYPPNRTEEQAYHQISACRTRPDRVWYGLISVWHWKGHSVECNDGRTSPHRTRSTWSRWRQADL